jgi:hypothetical protein
MRPPADAIQTAGCGPDLILVHGTGMDGASLAPLARLLEDRLRVTRYHRCGTLPARRASAPSRARARQRSGDLAIGLGGGPSTCSGPFEPWSRSSWPGSVPSWLQRGAFEPAQA